MIDEITITVCKGRLNVILPDINGYTHYDNQRVEYNRYLKIKLGKTGKKIVLPQMLLPMTANQAAAMGIIDVEEYEKRYGKSRFQKIPANMVGDQLVIDLELLPNDIRKVIPQNSKPDTKPDVRVERKDSVLWVPAEVAEQWIKDGII